MVWISANEASYLMKKFNLPNENLIDTPDKLEIQLSHTPGILYFKM